MTIRLRRREKARTQIRHARPRCAKKTEMAYAKSVISYGAGASRFLSGWYLFP